MAWYREWFGEDYLELYAHRDAGEAESHIDFVAAILPSPRPLPVLDLACGAGRHTEGLRRRGYRAFGVDLSLTLLARGPSLPRTGGNMLSLPFRPGAFGWVLNFFTSFGYFETERENFRVLEEVQRVLAPGGSFLLDLLNPEPAIRGLKARESQELAGRRTEIERWYDAASRRINKRIRVAAAGRPPRTYLESVRAYRLDEVRAGLAWAGFEIAGTYGGFGGQDYSEESERLILVAQKAGEK